MSVVVAGVNHKTAPVGTLERLAIAEDRLEKALHHVTSYEHVLEAVILSTCNRVEIYANVSRFHGGAQDLRNFLSEFCHVPPEDIADQLYTYHDDGAVRHLFRVAAGIDSLVVGESEILGQVRHAHRIAAEHGAAHRTLGAAFRQALRVGKRARTETAIGRNPASVSSAAVDLARRAFSGSLAGVAVAVVGAGKMGTLAARALIGAGATDVTVVNRTEERGDELAQALGARSVPFEALGDVLAAADILICSTTAPGTIVDRPLVEEAARRRSGPLFVVDIAVPRDVDPGVRSVPGVVLRDIDDLGEVVATSIGTRLKEVSRVEAIIAEELDRFRLWERAAEIGPTAAAVVAAAESVRAEETARAARLLDGLSDRQLAAVDRLTRRIVARLLHSPLDRARSLSAKEAHIYLAALRELFDLDDGP